MNGLDRLRALRAAQPKPEPTTPKQPVEVKGEMKPANPEQAEARMNREPDTSKVPDLTQPELPPDAALNDPAIQKIVEDPITDMLGGNVDGLDDEKRKIFNDLALELAGQPLTVYNDHYERIVNYLRLEQWKAQCILMLKQNRIKDAKDKREKERLIAEDLNWQHTRKKKRDKKTADRPKRKVLKKSDFDLSGIPKDLHATATSMMKAGISREKVLKFVQKMGD